MLLYALEGIPLFGYLCTIRHKDKVITYFKNIYVSKISGGEIQTEK